MTIQELFNETIEYLLVLTEVRNDEMMKIETNFKEKGAKNQEDINELINKGILTDSEIDDYYKVSQLIVDVRTTFQKICDIIYYSKILNLDLNIERINEVANLPLFVREYKSYKINFKVSPENKIEEINKKEYNTNKVNFKKILTNNNVINFINEFHK